MSDIIDRAQEVEAERTGRLIAAHRARSVAQGDGRCETCSEPIPAARLKAEPDALRCVECQTLFERKEAIRVGFHR